MRVKVKGLEHLLKTQGFAGVLLEESLYGISHLPLRIALCSFFLSHNDYCLGCYDGKDTKTFRNLQLFRFECGKYRFFFVLLQVNKTSLDVNH